MSRVNFTPREEEELLQILERYLPDLEREMSDTDSKEFHHALKERELLMHDFIKRLKAVVG
ncbi:MAG: hypothetical protein PHN75_15180 [Syntrophales bacterium]|nr:hypothetical protein [Syntrophales bacterium]